MPKIDKFRKRHQALTSERSSHISLYKELSDNFLGHRGRFLLSDRNKGHKRNTKIINPKPRLAARTLASGMMAGITSPARPWFKLSSGDVTLDEVATVKLWLHRVQDIIYKVFSTSNLYNALHMTYSELGVFGTAALGVYQDFENVIWCKPYTVGSYCVAADGRNQIDTFYREYQLTVGACVKEFGLENCSQSVQQQWEQGCTEQWITIVHAVEPNDDRDRMSPLARDKAYRSVYFESDMGTGEGGEQKFLRRSGFDTFPVMVPRFDLAGEDVYASDCPGMIVLGTTKALQLGERRKAQAVDKVANPPLQGDSTMRAQIEAGGLQKGFVWTDATGQSAPLSSVYGNWRPDLAAISATQQEREQWIDSAFFVDLFLMLSQSDRRQITAREVAEKHEEKLLMLGPVLERLHNELLDPLIDRTFNILQENGVLPPPPEELQGRQLDVQYVSVLAQAQRMAATGGLAELTNFAMSLTQVWPEARHKVNALEAIDSYANAVGVEPHVVNTDDQVQKTQAAEAQAQAQQQQMAQMQQMAEMAQSASQIDTSEGSALGDAMQGVM